MEKISVASFLLVCTLVLVSLAQLNGATWVEDSGSLEGAGDGRTKRDTTNQVGCTHELMERLKASCCKTPKLITKEANKACKLNENEAAESDKTRNVTWSERLCRHECIFKNLGWLSSGTIDTSKLTTALLAIADATWDPVVQAGITSCTTQLTSLGTLTPLPGSTCNPAPGLLLGCIRRYDMLNCPAPLNGTTCAADLQKLKDHEPFAAFKRISAKTG